MSTHTLVIALRRNERGDVGYAPSLSVARRCAASRSPDHDFRLATARPVGTMHEWALTAKRSRPRSVVLLANAHTIDARDLLEAELVRNNVAVFCAWFDAESSQVQPEGAVPHELTAFFGPLMDDLSPYRNEILPARLAPEFGIDVRNETGRRSAADIAADIEYVARNSYGTMVVPLWGGTRTDWLDDGLAEALPELLSAAARRRIGVRPVVPDAGLDVSFAEALATVAEDIQIQVNLHDASLSHLRRALAACGRFDISTSINIDIPGEDERKSSTDLPALGNRLAQLLQTVPDARVNADLATLRNLASQGALTGCPPQTAMAARLRDDRRTTISQLRRAYDGAYLDVPITAGVHDLWWGHRAPAREHEAWIASVISAGGSLLAWDVRESSVAHVSANNPKTIAASDIRRFAELDSASALGPEFVWISTPDDALALHSDIDLSWQEGILSKRLFDPAIRIAGLCRLGFGPCPTIRGRQWYVDGDGLVRTGLAGPVVGKVGDDVATLRSAVRSLPSQEPRFESRDCHCIPVELMNSDIELDNSRRRPWWKRVFSASEAVSVLSRDKPKLMTQDGINSIRISGLGGALFHSEKSEPQWSYDVTLMQYEAEFFVHSAQNGRTKKLSKELAFFIEITLDFRGEVMRFLNEQHGIEISQSQTLLKRTKTFLGELVSQPSGTR